LGGAYFINTSVKPEKAYETITTITQIMSDVKTRKQKINKHEVFKIVNQRNAFFPEAFRYNESIITNLIMNVEFKDRDPSYLNEYIRLYNTVTAAKAQKAFSKYAFPEKLFTVIVGKKEAVLPAFQEQGIMVKVIEL
jgi:zinc protease